MDPLFNQSWQSGTMTKLRIGLTLILLAALAGCGGGSGSDDDGTDLVGSKFVFWTGNSSGDEVIDANSQVFAFYADSGCLYNFQTDRENAAFCLTGNSNIVAYGPFRGEVVNVRSSTGFCIAALVEIGTGNFIEIAIDSFGREVVLVTQLRPALCLI